MRHIKKIHIIAIVLLGVLLGGIGGIWIILEEKPPQELIQKIDLFTNNIISQNIRDEFLANDTVSPPTPLPQPSMQNPPTNPLGDTSQQEFCGDINRNNFDCYEKFFKEIVGKKSIKAAFALLRQQYQNNDYARSQCHPLTHVIGQAAAKKFVNVSQAYSAGESFCWSGYYHGVMEGIIARIGFSNLTSQMNNICSDIADQRKYSFDHYNCVHGLGHGVMVITNNELFESLEICDVLSDHWGRSSCWGGAFMENVIVDNKNHFTKYLRPDDPLYPCNAAAHQYKTTCYLMQTSYMLKVTNGDFQKVFDLCGKVENEFQHTCYQSLGRDASGRSLSNVQQTKATCNLGKDFTQKSNCVIGAVKDFISYHHSDEEAKNLCGALEDENLKSVCASTAQIYVKTL